MTYYEGGKKRIGAAIAAVIAETVAQHPRFKVKGYCEPFCGMFGVYRHMPAYFDPKIRWCAGDRNPYVIKLWKALQRGWQPPLACDKRTYEHYRQVNDTSLKAIFVGYACAFRGQFRMTYMAGRNVAVQADACREIGETLKKVKLKCGEYTQFSKLKGCVIYCDPPYKNTKHNYFVKEKFLNDFDSDAFMEWCREMSRHNLVFISEYTKPCRDCKCIWQRGIEKLFLVNPPS